MCLTPGLVDRRRPLGPRPRRATDFLVLGRRSAASLVGFIGAEGRLGPLADATSIGAIFAALARAARSSALVARPTAASIGDLYAATADVGRRGVHRPRHPRPAVDRRSTCHHLLILGLLVLGDRRCSRRTRSSAIAGRSTRSSSSASLLVGEHGRRRSTTSSATWSLFSVAALFLLIRSTSSTSSPSGCAGGSAIRPRSASVYLRGGTSFIAVAVVGSLVLTATARIGAAGRGLGRRRATACSRSVAVGLAGSCRPAARAARIGHRVRADTPGPAVSGTPDDALAVTIQRDPTDNGIYYWRAIDLRPDRPRRLGAGPTSTTVDARRPTTPLLDRARRRRRRRRAATSFTFTVTPDRFTRPTILSPADADQRRPGRPTLTTVGDGGYFATLDAATADRAVHGHRADPGRRQRPRTAERRSRSARPARDYPAEIKALLPRRSPDGALGPKRSKLLEAKILRRRPASDDAVRPRRRTIVDGAPVVDASTTTPTSRDVPCCGHLDGRVLRDVQAGLLRVLRDRRWRSSCAHLGIPARIAEGFLPGHARRSDRRSSRSSISNAHAWVEVYFPGYGWVTFDPTGGDVVAARAAAVRQPGRERHAAAARRASRRSPTAAIPTRAPTPGRRRRRPARPAAARVGPLVAVAIAAARWSSASSRSSPGGAARAARRPPTARTAR